MEKKKIVEYTSESFRELIDCSIVQFEYLHDLERLNNNFLHLFDILSFFSSSVAQNINEKSIKIGKACLLILVLLIFSMKKVENPFVSSLNASKLSRIIRESVKNI